MYSIPQYCYIYFIFYNTVLYTQWNAVESASSLSYNLPPLLRVERKWCVPPSAKIGSQVAKVLRENSSDDNVTYELYTNGAPVPFEIEPHEGIVRVNDTLADKVNKTYSLWLTMKGGLITSRLEIRAVVDDGKCKPTLSTSTPSIERSPDLASSTPITNFTIDNDKSANVPIVTTNTDIKIY